MSSDQVRVASGSGLSPEEGPSSVSRRYAISESGLSAGISSMEPGEESGWHHHGASTTVFFMLSGSLRIEFGDDPIDSVVASPGDFGLVPAGVSHHEIGEGAEPMQAVVVRFSHGVHPADTEADDHEVG